MENFLKIKDIWEAVIFYKHIIIPAVASFPIIGLITVQFNNLIALQILSVIFCSAVFVALGFIIKLSQENTKLKVKDNEKVKEHDKDIFDKASSLLWDYVLTDMEERLSASGQYFFQHIEKIDDFKIFFETPSNFYYNLSIEQAKTSLIKTLNILIVFLYNNFSQVNNSHVYRSTDKRVLKKADKLICKTMKDYRKYIKTIHYELNT